MRKIAAISALVVLFGISGAAVGQIIHVDADANGLNNGSSWTNAYNYLQDALVDANSGDEIWVAQGNYKPDQGAGITPGDRMATFQLINGVAIKGGYGGFGEPDLNARDIKKYETILSGDLNGDDGPDFTNNGENSYHVVTANGSDETAVLEGFTITGGNADGVWEQGYGDGGGIFSYESSPTITNCLICGNSTGYLGHGAGMNNDSGSPTLFNCTFSRNSADRYGGAMLNYLSSTTLIDCTFIANYTRGSGGGMFNWSSTVTLTNCAFVENSTSLDAGGGILNYDSSLELTNCLFSGNSTSHVGGGLYIYDKITKLTNCTFSGNAATRKGGGIYNYQGDPDLTNCILWGNIAPIGSQISGTGTVLYSDVEGGWPGEGNIDADPLFVEPGYWDANGLWIEGDYHLMPGSPCIDAGDPNYVAEPNETDLDGKPRIMGGRIDMGAFEYRPSVPAEVRIVPRTINLASKGKWITCYISLPEDYDVADIDPNSFVLENEIQAESFRLDEEEQVAIVRFSQSEVQGILTPGEVELIVSGELADETVFEATDVIRVIDKGDKK